MTNVAEDRQGEGVRQRASSTVQDAASTTQDKAMELRSRGVDQLREQMETRTTDVGRQAQEVAKAAPTAASSCARVEGSGRGNHRRRRGTR